MRIYNAATLLLSATLAGLGLAMLVLTAVRGGGAFGFVVGALFVAAGVGRIWVQVRG